MNSYNLLDVLLPVLIIISAVILWLVSSHIKYPYYKRTTLVGAPLSSSSISTSTSNVNANTNTNNGNNTANNNGGNSSNSNTNNNNKLPTPEQQEEKERILRARIKRVASAAECTDPEFPYFDPVNSTCVQCFENSFNCLTGFQRCLAGICVKKTSPQCSFYPTGILGGGITKENEHGSGGISIHPPSTTTTTTTTTNTTTNATTTNATNNATNVTNAASNNANNNNNNTTR